MGEPPVSPTDIDGAQDGGAIKANCAGDGVGLVAAMMQADPDQGEPVQDADPAVAGNAPQPVDDAALT